MPSEYYIGPGGADREEWEAARYYWLPLAGSCYIGDGAGHVTGGSYRMSCWFRIFGTGHKHPEESYDGLRFLGTVLTENGSLVWHIFEEVTE